MADYFFVNTPRGWPYTPFWTERTESDRDRAERLDRELSAAKTARKNLSDSVTEYADRILKLHDAIDEANLENKIQPDRIEARIGDLVKMASIAEHGEREAREEIATLKNELAEVCSALASVTDRLASAA